MFLGANNIISGKSNVSSVNGAGRPRRVALSCSAGVLGDKVSQRKFLDFKSRRLQGRALLGLGNYL